MSAISVFALRAGGTEFRAMMAEPEKWEDWRKLNAKESLADTWEPPMIRFYEPGETGLPGDSRRRPLPTNTDMPLVFGCLMVVVSERFVATAGSAFLKYGEFLPCTSRDGKFFVYHCTNVLDALDEPKSELRRSRDGKEIVNIYKYYFRADAIAPDSVFRISEGNDYTIFITGAVDAAIRHPPLQGAMSELTWSSL